VLIAAIINLFTGKYPVGFHDLLLGLNRWSLRVYAYAALDDRRVPALPPRRVI
jgi:hypothetical protein